MILLGYYHHRTELYCKLSILSSGLFKKCKELIELSLLIKMKNIDQLEFDKSTVQQRAWLLNRFSIGTLVASSLSEYQKRASKTQ